MDRCAGVVSKPLIALAVLGAKLIFNAAWSWLMFGRH